MDKVEGVESNLTQSGTMLGGKRRRRGKSKSRRTRRRMRGGAPEAPMKLEGNAPPETMMGGRSRRKRRKGRKGKKSRSSRR
jgi:hypothetical protein